MSAIRRLARQTAERFHPEKIILFGSYAYGTPTPDSDVDLLVVMPMRHQVEQAVRIDEAVERGIPLDLLVRTPKLLEQRLRADDWFLREIMTRGKLLYEKTYSRVGTTMGTGGSVAVWVALPARSASDGTPVAGAPGW
jgi:predicted nucleotidyltransferase